jgi:polar amino acid transport system ATP-binding protein
MAVRFGALTSGANGSPVRGFNMGGIMIELQHVRKEYDLVTPLEDVSTTIQKGDVIAVIGPSGTGKSTLLRCINLLERPTSGHIFVDGEDITDKACNINRIRTKLGMVFQSFNLYEHLTVVENCMLAQTVLLKTPRQAAYDKAMQLLASVGMERNALQYPDQLSGGQKQRAAIARTLSTDPEIILFDEPTSALDPITVSEVEEVIAGLAKKGCTMMLVTHSMDFAHSVSNRVFYMDQGGIYEEGTPEQIFKNPQKERTRKFIRRLVSLEMDVTEKTHNLIEETGRIFRFLSDKELEPKRVMNVCHAYEEFCILMFRELLGDDRSLTVILEFSAGNNKLTMSFAPHSLRESVSDREQIHEFLEYKLISYYSVDMFAEQSDEGVGFRYTLEF